MQNARNFSFKSQQQKKAKLKNRCLNKILKKKTNEPLNLSSGYFSSTRSQFHASPSNLLSLSTHTHTHTRKPNKSTDNQNQQSKFSQKKSKRKETYHPE
jgi:hypothetical protein